MMRIALAQTDSCVGDLAGNAAEILRHARAAADAGARLVVFPELALTGAPLPGLASRGSFRAASRAALSRLAGELTAAGLGGVGVIAGFLDQDGTGRDDAARNAAGFLTGGEVMATAFGNHPRGRFGHPGRTKLEGLAAADRLTVVRFAGVDIALTVGANLWFDDGPDALAASLGAAGAGLVVNLTATPFEWVRIDARPALLARRAAQAGAALVQVNAVGGQDELVFDGGSMVVGADGALLARAPQFEAGLWHVDLELSAAGTPRSARVSPTVDQALTDSSSASVPPAPPDPSIPPGSSALAAADPLTIGPLAPARAAGIAPRLADEAEVWGALVTGTRDYARKNGFRSVLLGMSGGIDSALVATIAADALGADAVHGVSLPSGYSSEHSKTDAEELARRLGAHFRVVPIAAMVEQFVSALGLTGLAEENVQARVRGTTLMAISNAEGHLVLATGNATELAVGYSTIYGDAVGGFAPIKDVPKTLVWSLARWRNQLAEARGETAPIPQNYIDKPPSAELRPGQLDSDSLPDYELLDAVLARYLRARATVSELVADGFDAALVARVVGLVAAAEWKRRQYPPGPDIGAFGRYRLPITNRWREV